MRLAIAAVTLAVGVGSAWSESPPVARNPGPAPSIVLYTMGKGALLWEKFGHAAICVEYGPGSRRSRCYNYGTTDFTKPVSVGWGFLRGQGEFWVGVDTPEHMIARYKSFDRTLWRQVIPLPDDKARWLEVALATNALPENRFYTYHHYYDNCTTRIRDLLDQATDGALRRDSESVPGPSFREFSRQGFSQDDWLLVFSDFLLGRGADVRPDLWQAMFLPDYLREVVHERLGAEPEVIYERQGPQLTEGDSSGRQWILLMALLFAAPVALTRWRGRYQRLGIGVTASLLFLVALVPWFLAVVTAVEEFRYNEILLIFVPTDLALIWLSPTRRVRYARVRLLMVLAASLLLAVGVFQQPLWAPALMVFLPMLILAEPGRLIASRMAPARADQRTEASDKQPKPATRAKGSGGRQSGQSKRRKHKKR